MESSSPLIITAAIVGAETMRAQTPYVPYTPDEIAQEAARCRQAGASIVHVHGRLDDGSPTQSREVFAQILEKIRAVSDILVQFSTGGAVWMGVEERIEALDLLPDMATLTTGTVNFGDDVFMNSMPMIRQIAARLSALKIKPEIEIFEVGMLETAKRLVREGLLEEPLHVDFVMGVPGAMPANARLLRFLVDELPLLSTWSVAGIGRHELPLAFEAVLMGGHVRVGLEDNVYISKGELAKGSWELVAAVADYATQRGRALATPAQAAALLGVNKTNTKQ